MRNAATRLAGSVAITLSISAVAPSLRAQEQTDPSSTCSGKIDGDVVDKKTHQPIAGASVFVAGEFVTVTDEAGHFAASSVCAGQVRVEAERADYARSGHSVALSGNASVEIELSAKEVEGRKVVVVDKAPEPVTMQSTAEVSGKALERTRGRGFAEALAEVPGVSQLKSAGGMSKPIVRGQFGRRLLLLVDGIRHRSQEWGLDHAPEIDPFTAGKITVVRGAAGVRYGSDAIGGAVLVASPELPSTPGVAGEVHAIGISNGRGGGMASRVSGAMARMPGLSWQVEGTGKRLAAARTPDYALDNTGVKEWTLGARVGYRASSAHYELAYRRYQAELGVCSCLRIESSDDFFAQLELDEPAGAGLFDDSFDIRRPYQAVAHDTASAKVGFERALGKLTATYAFQFDHRREFDIVRTSTGPQFDFRLESHDLGVAFEHNPLHVSDHLHLRGSAGLVGAAQFHGFSGLPLVPDHEAYTAGLYVAERLLGEDFEIEAGVRYDFLTRTANIAAQNFQRLVRSDQLAMDSCGDASGAEVDCESTFHTVSASVGGLVQLGAPWSAKLILSTASRAPNPDEQYLNGTAPTSPVLGLGKPDLQPETTYSAALSSSWDSERISAETSVYANYVFDYIYFAPAIDENGDPIFDVLSRGAFPRFVTRPVNARFFGVDGGVAVRALPWLELGGQLSMVRGDNTSDDSPLVLVPPHRFRGSLTISRDELLGFREPFARVGGTYVARQTRFDVNADFAPPPDGYFLVDAEIGAGVTAFGQLAKVALSGTNLLNQRYREYTSLLRYFVDQPGWQVLLRLSFHFDSRTTPKGPS